MQVCRLCSRRYAKEFELIDAIEQAVDECIQRNILSEFLRKKKAEVIAMSIFEYDKEEEKNGNCEKLSTRPVLNL